MSRQTESGRSEICVAIKGLDKKFRDLESQLTELRTIANCTYRQGFSRGMVLGLVPFLGVLFFIGSLLYAQNVGDPLFIDSQGNVGIGTITPNKTLDVAGTLNVTKSATLSDTTIKGSLTTTGSGNVGIGTTDPEARLDVHGDARIRGTVRSQGRYQRDDQAETTYEISPRYHLSLTASQYAGRTKTIPQDVIEDLCGDQDGCEFRLGMTRWDSDKETETASRSGLFYYSKTDGHWRASFGKATPVKEGDKWKAELDTLKSDLYGIDGDGTTSHARYIWSTCYFTDGIYAGNSNQGDTQKGMQLLVWDGYTHPKRTCELTLID